MNAVVLNRAQSRDVDRIAIHDYGFNGLVLMENAGRGCVELMLKQGIRGGVVICCGPGNNGGDGFVIARHLAIHRIPVKTLMLTDPARLTGDALSNYSILQKSHVPIEVLPHGCDETAMKQFLVIDDGIQTGWIVDAMLGTGAIPPVRSPFDSIVRLINDHSANLLAVDIPTGLDCDSGDTPGVVVKADLTVTFETLKPCFTTPNGQSVSGSVHVVRIGIPEEIVQRARRERG